MGVSYSASIMVGILKKDCIEERKTVENVKRFNEQTGEPYEKEIINEEGLFFGNTEIDETCELEFKHGFSVGYTSEGCSDEDVVGVIVTESGDLNYGGGSEEINLSEIEKKKTELKAKLQTFGVEKEPKLYLVCSVG